MSATPGPWTVRHQGFHITIMGRMPTGWVVASIMPNTKRPEAEREANAKLLAAAPALLEALEVTTGTLEALFKGNDLGHARNAVGLAMQKARAAIQTAS